MSDDLQFDRAVVAGADAGTTAATAPLVCARCGRPIEQHYYEVNGHTICSDCRRAIVQAGEQGGALGRSAGSLARAVVFGLGAAIAGAIIYYAVVAITGWEIGYVSILIGYMVGWSVMKATKGRGGRRYQILAIALTYFAICLAYSPLAFSGATDPAYFLTMIFALPVIVVYRSLPGGLLSAAIIIFGMLQAWRMTAGGELVITGPYKLGTAPPTPPNE